jgi:hypothetical protein
VTVVVTGDNKNDTKGEVYRDGVKFWRLPRWIEMRMYDDRQTSFTSTNSRRELGTGHIGQKSELSLLTANHLGERVPEKILLPPLAVLKRVLELRPALTRRPVHEPLTSMVVRKWLSVSSRESQRVSSSGGEFNKMRRGIGAPLPPLRTSFVTEQKICRLRK